jgi:hypothetical protein
VQRGFAISRPSDHVRVCVEQHLRFSLVKLVWLN